MDGLEETRGEHVVVVCGEPQPLELEQELELIEGLAVLDKVLAERGL